MKLSKRGIVMKETKGILEVRNLTKDDLPTLREPRMKAPAVKRFRDPHHRLARLFALGIRRSEVVKRSGFGASRVDVLWADPAFQDLISKYRGVVDESFKDVVDDYAELATANMLKAERMLAEKLDAADEADELLPTRELIAISRDAADRFGYGKKQTNLNVNVDFAAKLEERQRRHRTINHSPSVVPSAGSTPPARPTVGGDSLSEPSRPPLLLRRI